MSGSISPATARVCLKALRVAWELGEDEAYRNGRDPRSPAVLAGVRVAVDELVAVVRSGDGFADATGDGARVVSMPRSEQIDTAECARRLGISPQAVRKRLAVGSLPGQQVGGVWIVEWRADDDGTAPVLVRGAAASAGRVDESREVTGG